jgi:hypothetical protein
MPRDREDRGLRPVWANSLQDPISKITRTKWTGGVAKVVEHLLCKHKTLSSKPQSHKQNKIKRTFTNASIMGEVWQI